AKAVRFFDAPEESLTDKAQAINPTIPSSSQWFQGNIRRYAPPASRIVSTGELKNGAFGA
ncbi:MAG: hypothetical protein HGA72_07030, partial [Chlorobiaceae bacterium]|nr:hypothetical protein [Chlorobiaceae bacterium]